MTFPVASTCMHPQYDVSVKVEELSVCSRRATITVPASAVKDVFKRGVKRIEVWDGRTAALWGCLGHAPLLSLETTGALEPHVPSSTALVLVLLSWHLAAYPNTVSGRAQGPWQPSPQRDVVGQLRGWQEGKPLPLSMVITQASPGKEGSGSCWMGQVP